MSRIMIVARTRMRGGHVCIGGHDLDQAFRGVRLLDWFGDHWPDDSPFMVGEMWDIQYGEKAVAPPHVEDVIVKQQRRLGTVTDLKALVLKNARPWTGAPEALYYGTVRNTPTGSA